MTFPYGEYWNQFLLKLDGRSGYPLKRSAPRDNYIQWACFGRTGFKLFASAHAPRGWISVNFGIYTEAQKHHFDGLKRQKADINKEINAEVRWERIQGERSDTQAVLTDYKIDLDDKDEWGSQHDWMLDYLAAFYGAFAPRVSALR